MWNPEDCAREEVWQEVNVALQAADTLAKASKASLKMWTSKTYQDVVNALAAYEKVRSLK